MARLARTVKELGPVSLFVLSIYGLVAFVASGDLFSQPRDWGPGFTFKVTEADGASMGFDREIERFVTLQKGMEITACDLRTGPSGSVSLQGRGLTLTLSNGARGHVDPDTVSFGMKLFSGKARLALESGTPAQVIAPEGTIRSRGGEISIDVEPGFTVVRAESGEAEIVSGGRKQVISGGAPKRLGPTRADLPRLPGSMVDAGTTGGTLSVPNQRGSGRTALRVADLRVEIILDGRIAQTRIDQTFANDGPRRCEGRYAFVLPPGAMLSRYAMFTSESRMVEGEIVARQEARRIYTEIVRRMQDPALVEWQQGNLFTARIFPIEPYSHKRVLLSYTQVLPRRFGRSSYVFPLVSGLTKKHPLENLDISVQFTGRSRPASAVVSAVPGLSEERALLGTEDTARFSAENITPEEDFRISMQFRDWHKPDLAAHRLASDDVGFFMLALPPGEGSNPEKGGPVDLVLYIDSSLSRSGLAHKLQLKTAEFLLSQLAPSDRFLVRTFDAETRAAYRDVFLHATSEQKAEALQALSGLVPLGGSDFHGALEALRRDLSKAVPGRRRTAVLLTDGMATMGRRNVAEIVEALGEDTAESACPVHVLALGNPVNKDLLQSITRRTKGLFLQATDAPNFDRALLDLAVAVEGAADSSASFRLSGKGFTVTGEESLHHLPPGVERLLWGRFQPGAVLRAHLNGRQYDMEFPFLESGNSFVPRLWAASRMTALVEKSQDEAVRKEMISLSEKYTIVCPYTSFLVLEKEEDYARWGIDRKKRRAYWKPWLIEARPLGRTRSSDPARRKEAPEPATAPPPRIEPEGVRLGDIDFTDLIYEPNTGDTGRIVTTATCVLCLEIYYRYGRILNVRQGDSGPDFSGARLNPSTPPREEPAGREQRDAREGFRPASPEREVFEGMERLNVDEPPIEDPVLKDAEISDHNETDSNEDYESSKGVEDAIADRPFQGKYWNSAIGIGGGSGGTFGGRFGGRRNLRAYGGGRHTESAVLMGSIYLKNAFVDKLQDRNTLEVSLALLAFLGAGHTHKHGKFKRTVKSLLKFLKDRQRADGIFEGAPQGAEELAHALCTAAFSEAYGLTNKSPLLQAPAEKAVRALLGMQRSSGGFGRTHSEKSDTVATAFAVLAFKSARISGLQVPASVFEGAERFLKSTSGAEGGEHGLHGPPEREGGGSLIATAAAAIAKIFIRGSRAGNQPDILASGNILGRNLPQWGDTGERCDMTYLYLGTLAMFQLGRSYWKAWNPVLKDALVPTQSRERAINGTWPPRPSYLLGHVQSVRVVTREELLDALETLANAPDRAVLDRAARFLTAVRDLDTLAELAGKYPVEGVTGQMVRMRLGIVRILEKQIDAAVEPISSAYVSAGAPDSFLDLYLKALVGSKRIAEAVGLLGEEALKGRLDDQRAALLAGLLLDPTSGVKDSVDFARNLGSKLRKQPLALYQALAFGLTEKNHHASSLDMAYILFRKSGYDPQHLPILLNRLTRANAVAAVRELYLETFGKSQADNHLASALAHLLVWEGGKSPEQAVQAIRQVLGSIEHAEPRRKVFRAVAAQGRQRHPAVAAAALEALLEEEGRSPHDLAELEMLYFKANKFKEAASIAFELILEGRVTSDDIVILQKAANAGAIKGGQAYRIMTSWVEMSPYDAETLKGTAQALRKDGREAAGLALLREAFRLNPDDSATGFQLADALKKLGDEKGFEAVLFDLLGSTWKENRAAVWDRAEKDLRNWIRILSGRGEERRVSELEKRLGKALALDLEIEMKWDTALTDVDLHVTEPGGVVCNYQRKTTPGGGVLDRDVTNGFGPETYVIRRAKPGNYVVRVIYYSGGAETRATIKIRKNVGTPEETEEVRDVTLLKRGQNALVAELTIEDR